MRKRSQRRSKIVSEEPKHIAVQKTKIIEEKKKTPLSLFKVKKWWIPISLVCVFFLVLTLNTYWNFSSEATTDPTGSGLTKYYLSGPDPYYNMRIVDGTVEDGHYPYYSERDPMLDYPLGSTGSRGPLFSMMAISFSSILTPFMSEADALGISMQFVPALFGALLIFPVYFIGKEIFNKKAGLFGALFIALIPIHLGSGHGSAFTLFDHDSFNLLLFFITFLFLIKSVKAKTPTKTCLFAFLAGLAVAGVSMTWVEARYLYVIIGIYAVVQMLIDVLRSKSDYRIFLASSITLFTGYLLSLPVISSQPGGLGFSVTLFICVGVTVFGIFYLLFGKKKVPWAISIPMVVIMAIAALFFLYFIKDISRILPAVGPLSKISELLFGSGIYGSKVSMTIAEANTYQISNSVMSFGPVLYWVGWTGFLFLLYLFYRDMGRRDYLFLAVLFVMDIWLTGIAGRFVNDMVPMIALLSGWVVYLLIEKIDYKQMLKNIKSAGGGLYGIRRGMKFLHIFGIIFVFFILFTNAFIAMDAAVPNASTQNGTSTLKTDMFGDEHTGAYGLSIGKERYWGHAFKWLSSQDTEIVVEKNRPAFISWWDYGFYEVAMGGHPTVADNFQDGIPTASNFHTATSEEEAVAILIVRLLEGDLYDNDRILSNDAVDILTEYLGSSNASNIKLWMEDPTASPSYNGPIAPQYDQNLSKEYRIGEQWTSNAYYHDIVDLIVENLDDDEITWLYHKLQDHTGYSVRYYGVEGYDKQIFNIFAFLSDKSLLMIAMQSGGVYNTEDDFVLVKYEGQKLNSQGEVIQSGLTWTAKELKNMPEDERKYLQITGTTSKYKDDYFNTMFYKTYIGPAGQDSNSDGYKEEYDYQFPCLDMRHFCAEYISPIEEYAYYQGKSAVVIAKYYEGAYINGTIWFNGEALDNIQVVVTKNIYHYGQEIPIDHDKKTTVVKPNSTQHFHVIAPAGNITLNIRRYPELEGNAFLLKEITFDSDSDPNLFPITDDEAMRRDDSYTRTLNISIDPANVDGYIYKDLDNDGKYNVDNDTLIKNATVNVYEILTPNVGGTPTYRDSFNSEDGYYNISGLFPGYYRIEAINKDGYRLEMQDYFPLYSGNNSHNISEPQKAGVKGYVYYDENGDDELEYSDTIISDANVELSFNGKSISNVTTDSKGYYEFTDLIPGTIGDFEGANSYTINISYGVYETEESLSPTENKTIWNNISIDLKKTQVSGYVTYKGQPIQGTPVTFKPDPNVENNSAKEREPNTDPNGYYSVDLKPGSYLVDVNYEINGVLAYTNSNKNDVLTIERTTGGEEVPHSIALDKHSVTVSGTTKYAGQNVDNSTITYSVADFENDIEIISDENGEYSVELPPSISANSTTTEYAISANSDPFEESGTTYIYRYSGTILVSSSEISSGELNEDITLTKQLYTADEE